MNEEGFYMMTPKREVLEKVYGKDFKTALERYEHIASSFEQQFPGVGDVEFFTAPGRTEIIGNHTDHNGGRVIAGSINLDTIGAAVKTEDDIIEVVSEGYKKVTIDIHKLSEVPKGKKQLLSALVTIQSAPTESIGFHISIFLWHINNHKEKY
jgi:galactokinase